MVQIPWFTWFDTSQVVQFLFHQQYVSFREGMKHHGSFPNHHGESVGFGECLPFFFTSRNWLGGKALAWRKMVPVDLGHVYEWLSSNTITNEWMFLEGYYLYKCPMIFLHKLFFLPCQKIAEPSSPTPKTTLLFGHPNWREFTTPKYRPPSPRKETALLPRLCSPAWFFLKVPPLTFYLLSWWIFTDCTMVNHPSKMVFWENMFGTFSKHQIYANPGLINCLLSNLPPSRCPQIFWDLMVRISQLKPDLHGGKATRVDGAGFNSY